MVRGKFYLIIHCVLCLLFFTACGEKAQLNPNSLFKFENLTDSYDSSTNTFTRRYSSDTIRIKVILTQEEKKRVFQTFSENNFQDFPNKIDCSSWGVSSKIYDELTLNNLTVKYVHNTDQGLFCITGKKFSKISIQIQSVLMNKPEVKKLELSDIFYE